MDDLPLVCLGCGTHLTDDLPCATCALASLPLPEAALDTRVEASRPRHAASFACASCGGSIAPGDRACSFCRATVRTARCGHCLAWNLASSRHCGSCGDALDDVERRVESLPCPRCAPQTLRAVRYRDLVGDECVRCGGIFLAASFLDRLVERRDHAAGLRLALPERPRPALEPVQYVRCPGCTQLMNRRQFGAISGVIVDTCRTHGVWFDGGELHAVLAFIARGGLSDARTKEMRALEVARAEVASKRAEQEREALRREPRGYGDAAFARWVVRSWLG